jgi:outer membrane protein assembly factor BamB
MWLYIAGALLVMSAPAAGGDAPELRHLYPLAGWGRPAADGSGIYYLAKHHELLALERRSGALRWRRPLHADAGVTAGTTIVVSGDIVIAGDQELFAFDTTSGRPRWRLDLGDDAGRFLGPVSSGLLFTGSASGRVHAIDAHKGNLRWSSPALGAEVTVFEPITAGDAVLAGYTDFRSIPRSGGVVSLDAEDGSLRWRTIFPSDAQTPAGYGGGPVVLGDDAVAVTASDGSVHVLDRVGGRILWTLPPIGRPASASSTNGADARGPGPAAEDFRALAFRSPMLFVTSLTGRLSAFDVRTRQEIWRSVSPADGSIAFAVTLAGPSVYVPYASGRLAALDAASGRQRWTLGGPDQRFEWPPGVPPGGGSCDLSASRRAVAGIHPLHAVRSVLRVRPALASLSPIPVTPLVQLEPVAPAIYVVTEGGLYELHERAQDQAVVCR